VARKGAKFLVPKNPGGVRVIVDEAGLAQFVELDPGVREALMGTAHQVAAQAQATASDAENGAGGRIDGYADAGFSVEWESRGGKRPRVNIVSNADSETATAVHFYTQKRDGVAHMRAALYAVTGE
jgi:hypothetical protein